MRLKETVGVQRKISVMLPNLTVQYAYGIELSWGRRLVIRGHNDEIALEADFNVGLML
jgi:hypothetical protein